ncbi:MAG: class I SAM-dependent methyltransferase [Ilumatobacteraceae bacterium]
MGIFDNSDKTWDKIARSEPYYGVLTADRFRSGQLNDESMAEFFQTGHEHIAHTIATAAMHLGCQIEYERGLDFGCGVGRLVIPMATRFKDVVGVDVSSAYRSLAQENCAKHAASNVRLVESVDAISTEIGTYDFVHSHLVFLHIPVRRGLPIMRGLVELLKPGGVGALHLLYHRDIGVGKRALNAARKYFLPLHWVLNAVSNRSPFELMMQANEYPLDRALQLLSDLGVSEVYVELSRVHEGRHAFLYFRKSPAA